jgi:hypothetical protein
MTAARKKRQPGKAVRRRSSPLDALTLPALAACLKGYLHQDYLVEHGSARAAVAAFARDASGEERAAVGAELARLAVAAQNCPAADLRAFVTRRLGGGWEPQSVHDLEEAFTPIAGPSAR